MTGRQKPASRAGAVSGTDMAVNCPARTRPVPGTRHVRSCQRSRSTMRLDVSINATSGAWHRTWLFGRWPFRAMRAIGKVDCMGPVKIRPARQGDLVRAGCSATCSSVTWTYPRSGAGPAIAGSGASTSRPHPGTRTGKQTDGRRASAPAASRCRSLSCRCGTGTSEPSGSTRASGFAGWARPPSGSAPRRWKTS